MWSVPAPESKKTSRSLLSSAAEMSEEPPTKKLRKGTRSCTECRRRKIRCVWVSDDARTCRRCEEQETECVAQTVSSRPPDVVRLTSRERISHLEQQVGALTKALRGIQERLGEETTFPNDFVQADTTTATLEESDLESETPDELGPNAPAYLRSLFDNNIISSEDHKGAASKSSLSFQPLIRKAREELRRLIPPKEDVAVISRYASAWLSLYHALFPTRFVAHGGHELVSQHEEMTAADVEPTVLAIWLISIAITAQQVSRDVEDQLTGIKSLRQYPKMVAEAVANNIMEHDSLLGTLEGVEMALHYFRLLLNRGSFMKVWITLRRVIAISEMIGLPQAAKMHERTKDALTMSRAGFNLSKADEERLIEKAEVWTGICMVDRIAGMMFNLPAGTYRYQLPSLPVVDSNGQILVRGFMGNLAGISKHIFELDDGPILGGSDADLYAEVLSIDQELISLARLPPASWWGDPTPGTTANLSEQILKYWHSYLTVRVHLKFTLQKDANQQFDYSRYTCMTACNIAINRYLGFRSTLPGGFFVGRVVDLQALTVAVVLLLAYHNSRSTRRRHVQAQTIESPASLIAQLIEVMESLSTLRTSDFATQAVVTLRSLSTLLGDDSASERRELTLTVPLLGKIHVHKNKHPVGNTIAQDAHALMDMDLAQVPVGSQSVPPSVFTPATSDFSSQSLPVTNSWSWDPLSLFIEDDDREAIFQHAIFAEDFGQMDASISYSSLDFGGYS